MAALALADVLQDFGATPRFAAAAAEIAALAESRDGTAEPPKLPALDPALIRAEVEKAEAALAATLTAEHEAQLAALEQAHVEQVGRIHAESGAALGAAMAEKIDAVEARLLELTSSVTARILGAALSDDLQRRAVDQLARVLNEALADREAVRIRVRGPASLYEALLPALGRHAERAEFTEASELDLSVSIDESIYETRLSEWSAALAEVVS